MNVEFNTGHYSIALSKHKEKVEGLMLIMNEMKNKIVSKRQEIINLQSEQIATKIEIEKVDKQLKSMMELIENFEVIFFHIFCLQLNVLSLNTLLRKTFFSYNNI